MKHIHCKYSIKAPLWIMLLLAASLAGQSNPGPRRLTRADLERVPAALIMSISVAFDETPLDQALHMLAVEGDFQLSYNMDQIPVHRRITLQLTNVPALEALLRVAEMTGIDVVMTNGQHLALVPTRPRPGSIAGQVMNSETGEPLHGANVLLAGTYLGAATDQTGHFEIQHVYPGEYAVQASMMGYKPRHIAEVVYDGRNPVDITIALEPTVISLSEIIITPGHFSLMEDIPTTRHALRAEDIRSFPQLGEDIYRAVNRLPGLANNDFAAGFYIRGGRQNEVLVLLDGMELYNPFHLKIQDGFMSFIDVESIRSIEMMTGAFPAEYGNRLSGVFNLNTISPQPHARRTSLAISFLNARLLTENSFAEGRGRWKLLARRGYVDLLLKVAGQEVEPPFYYDILNKIQFNLTPRQSVSAHIILACDRWNGELDQVDVTSNNDNLYGWLTWNSQWNSGLTSRTIVSRGGYDDLISMIAIEGGDREPSLKIKDRRYLQFWGLKQDWTWEFSEKYLLKWGFNARDFRSHIDYYHRDWVILGQIDTYFVSGYNLASRYRFMDGVELNGYLSQRIRPVEPLAVEMGLRYESSTWTQERHWSPRINLAYSLNERTSLRGGWGHYYQTQNLTQELGLYGDPEFYPAERAEHRVIGFEHNFTGGVQLRVVGYQKVLTSLRPHYITWEESTLRPIPMVDIDRLKLEPEAGEAWGLEFYIRRETGHKLSYWLSYSLAKVSEKVDGQWIPRFYDQRHTLYCDLSWKPNHKWRVNLALQYHSGWPYTKAQVVDLHEPEPGYWSWRWEPGPLYAERFPDYKRVDFRLNRYFHTRFGRITGFFEFRNALDFYNPRKYQFAGSPTPISEGSDEVDVKVRRYKSDGWLGILPSFGIIWDL
ncbi:MAG: TonB-dependent receptor [Fidelibacterota bacterium]|nr:MAG: TonB-dependent receptor [Candidatus Neomarinimicrobiota bacterium]